MLTCGSSRQSHCAGDFCDFDLQSGFGHLKAGQNNVSCCNESFVIRKRSVTEQREYLFVYGSLKRGFRLHDALIGEEYLGEFRTLSNYRLFDCGHYPALVPDSLGNGVAVRGELYRVASSTWPLLDDIEGVAEGLYRCGAVDLQDCKLNSVIYAYFYLHSTSSLVSLGDEWPGSGCE